MSGIIHGRERQNGNVVALAVDNNGVQHAFAAGAQQRRLIGAGNNFLFNAGDFIDLICLLPGNNAPGSVTVNFNAGANTYNNMNYVAFVTGTISEASPRWMPGPGRTNNASAQIRITCGANAACMVFGDLTL